MRNFLYLAIFFIFVYKATAVGSSSFYAEFTLTNREYGAGAQFPCQVWYDLASKNMRIDYYQPDGKTKFMTVYYNYTSKDKYQICGTGATANCSRATWTSPQPPFQFTPPNLYTGPAAQCVTPDWSGPRACPTNCATYTASPAQPQGISSLSHIDGTAAANLCLVRWTPGTGFTYGPEWHITLFQTSGYTKGSPTDIATYSQVLTNVKCPTPTCFAEIDIALSIDESGSIGSNWPTVQNFVKGLISSLDIRATAARVGLSYFSGLGYDNNGNCVSNFTGTGNVKCAGNCGVCGGLWNTLTPEVSTDKANLIALADAHVHQKGFTCISCGVDQGIRILNAAPKANVQKLIILMTDGAQNMVTDRLVPMATLAKSMGIDVIAVGVANYKLSDLQVIASNDKIYTSPDFAGLAGLIQQIITPLCQPLPSIDTCNFCSGLCSCQANCNCPTCNDYNACTLENCDVRPAPQGTGGVCVSTNVTCEDNNVCTQNLCSTSTGCYYTTPTPQPANLKNTFCKFYQCQNPQGFVQIDQGDQLCGKANKCLIGYCNETGGAQRTGACESIDRTATPFGATITYTTSAGQTITTTGCGRKANSKDCQQYICNTTTGACVEDNSACVCLKDSDCNDSNGCTTDTCSADGRSCSYTTRDCWADVSGNNCVSISQTVGGRTFTQTAVGVDTAVSDAFYANGPGTQNLVNGLPPNVTRSCAELACYRGQRSTYTCQSLSSSTSQCVRTVTNCTSTGCVDNVCRTSGGWTSGQVNTDCNYPKNYVCDDTLTCTRDDCVSTFSGVNCYTGNQCLSTNGVTRCNFVPLNSRCDDGTVCTTDFCNATATRPGTGCVYTNVPVLPQNLCFLRGCHPQTGPFSNPNTTACPQQTTNLCIINYCDPSGSGSCATIDKTTLPTTSTRTYTDANGNPVTVAGCQKADQGCYKYGCDPLNGLCTVDNSTCKCSVNSDCDDKNGCTTDVCDKTDPLNPVCLNTPIDCFNILSNGGCKRNGAFSPTGPDTATGLANYQAGAKDNAFVQPTAPATLTCNQMGCYSGRRSTYTCVSNPAGDNYTCNRTYTACPFGGCTDNICRTLGTWSTNGQIDTECALQRDVKQECGTATTKCQTSVCNATSLITDTNRCIVTDTSGLCNDGDLCTDDICDPVGGCSNPTKPNTNPPNKCYTWQCDPKAGFFKVDAKACPPTNGGCTINYCDSNANNGAGDCVPVNKTSIALGTTKTFTDYAGNTISVEGCGRAAGDQLNCRQYLCNVTDGQCYKNETQCQCTTDSNCEDGNVCTTDKCVLATGTCSRENYDCWSVLSNGACVSNINSAANNPIFPNSMTRPVASTVGLNIDIGLAQYYGNFSKLGINFNLDANGLPSPSSGVSRTCAHLACYNGNPSTYTCIPNPANISQPMCQRVTTNCGRNGCQDNICRVPGGAWTADFQQRSDCNTTFRPNCADKDSCTNDFCNTAWVPTDPADQRCIHTSLNSTGQCDDGNFCTFDYCDSNDTSSNPCKHNLYNDKYVRKNLCKNGTRCDNVQCTVNRCIYTSLKCLPSNLCVFYKCNTSTNGTCGAFPTGLYKFDKCGVCGGNGLSCVIITPANPNRTSIAVALGVGLGVGLCFAAAIIAFLSKKSFDMYNAIGLEQQGTVTNNPTHQGGDDHIDTSHYN